MIYCKDNGLKSFKYKFSAVLPTFLIFIKILAMNISIITFLTIAVTGIITYKGLADYQFFSKYNFDISALKKGEKYRMITSGFLHIDWMHFIFNMLTLYFFADIIVYSYGVMYFVIVYLLSMLAGNFLTFQFYKNTSNYRAVGASGAIMGILYASIMLNPNMSLYLFFIPIPIPAYLVAIGYLFYSIYGINKSNDNIGHTAHLGGAVAGLILIILREPILFIQEKFLVAVLLLPVLFLFYMQRKDRK